MAKGKRRPKRIPVEGTHLFRITYDGATATTTFFVDGYRIAPPNGSYTYYIVIDNTA